MTEKPDLKIVPMSDREQPFSEETFDLGMGTVTIRSIDPTLTVERALFLLEGTKTYIMKGMIN